MKRVSFSLLLIALALFNVSCTKKHNTNEKVLNLIIEADVKGFDPIYATDSYAGKEVARVYDGLLEYHYLKRPYVLQPNLAESMPEVSNNGLTYTFTLKKGVLFHDSPAFPKGKAREVVAEDVKYSFLRVADPKLISGGFWVIDGKVKGLNEWRKVMASADRTDYRSKIDGVKVLDKYRIQFTLTKPFPQFQYAFAMSFFKIVPREAVEHFGKEFVNHPVGTGPYRLKKYDRTGTIVYTKNPTFRDKFYPTEGAPGDKEKGLLANAGKKLPLADKIIAKVQIQPNPRWLNFQRGKFDLLIIPKDNFDQAITPAKELTPEMIKKGFKLDITPGMDVTYNAFNHDIEIFKNKKLRQAMSLAYDVEGYNTIFYNGNGLLAQSLIPPGVAGYDPNYKNPYARYDLKAAKKLLAEAGYPEGKGLPVINYECLSSTTSRQGAEYFAKAMSKVGIKVNVTSNTWPEMTKKIKNRKAMMWGISWLADYPDAENFLQLIYGPNSSPGANGSNYDNPKFNKLFEKAAVMPFSDERTALYEKLMKMAAEEVPWIYGVHRKGFSLVQGWIPNYKRHAFDHGMSMYYDVDLEAKKKLIKNL